MIKTVFVDLFRLLTFRATSPAMAVHWKPYLATGLLFTWLAGIGRYWDNPREEPWQWLGLGSVAYVFILALLLWLLLWPLRPAHWSYRNVLLFITLTAPPGLLYAVPVERFMTPDAARAANAWFLAVVAAWRLGLFSTFLRRVGRLPWFTLIVATLTPMALIVIALALLNLEHVVFNLMGGMRPEERSPNDTAYRVVFLLGYLSYMTAPVLLAGYLVAAGWARRDRATEPAADSGVGSAPEVSDRAPRDDQPGG